MADPTDVAERLVHRNHLFGTPTMQPLDDFYSCYLKILNQYQTNNDGTTIWSYGNGRWSLGTRKLQTFLDKMETDRPMKVDFHLARSIVHC